MGPPQKKSTPLTHLNEAGAVHMVDVGDKADSRRVAIAQAQVHFGKQAKAALKNGAAKGEVLATARIAGIQAAKQTSTLIPLCHPISLSHISIDILPTPTGLRILAQAETVGPTGVEMEAMCAASVAALTIYDMLKGVERGMVIDAVQLMEKRGGRSGVWRRAT